MDINYNELKVLVALSNSQASAATRHYFSQKKSYTQAVMTRPEALEHMKASNFNLVITDDKFSDMGGIDFVRYIRFSGGPIAYTRVILGLSQADKNLVLTARNAGVEKMVLLPLTFASLQKSIKEVIFDKRHFLQVPNYTGIDRRIKKGSPPRGEERRLKQEGVVPPEKVATARAQ